MGTEKKRFRLRAKRLFLTYPQLPSGCGDLRILALENYERIFGMSREEFKYVITEELHEDGNPHLHVYLEFKQAQKIYSPTKLDLILPGLDSDVRFHGNYQAAKSEHRIIKYIVKAAEEPGDVLTNKELPIHEGEYYSNATEHLHAVLRNEGLKAAIKVMYDMYPKVALHRGGALINNMATASAYYHAKEESEEARTLSDFTDIPKEIYEWMERSDEVVLILFGPTGTGKTQLAKAIFNSMKIPFLMVRDLNGLSRFDPAEHRGLIFDDLDLGEKSREELIHLYDMEENSDIRILYRVVVLQAGIPRIFTTNEIHQFLRNETALKRRAQPVEVAERMFKLSTGKPIRDGNYELAKPVHPSLIHYPEHNPALLASTSSTSDAADLPAQASREEGSPPASTVK